MAALEPLLQTRGLSKRFGGLHAVKQVDLAIFQGEIRAIIGPNGAGKTTLVSLICGRLHPTSGTIHLKGRNITAFSAAKKVQAGIVYTFQVTSLFTKLSCFENVALATQRRSMEGAGFLSFGEALIKENVERALSQVGLQGTESTLAGSLPHGHQRLLEVAMGLAARPKLLILDEPTQGLAEGEINELCQLIRDLSGELTILLIEHNMSVVLDLALRITVMDQGSILAEGTPREIETNPDVQDSYLGS